MFLIVSRLYVDFGFDHPFFLRAQKVRCLERAQSTPESTVPLYVFYTKTIDVLIFFKKKKILSDVQSEIHLVRYLDLKKIIFRLVCCTMLQSLYPSNTC